MDEVDDDWRGVEAALARFGLPPRAEDRTTIVAALEGQIRLETDFAGDQHLMRLLCGLLFSFGYVEDSLLVWRAKECTFDTHCGIDVAFLCGAGLPETKSFLAARGTLDADKALAYLRECEASGNFDGFDVAAEVAEMRRFYGVE